MHARPKPNACESMSDRAVAAKLRRTADMTADRGNLQNLQLSGLVPFKKGTCVQGTLIFRELD